MEISKAISNYGNYLLTNNVKHLNGKYLLKKSLLTQYIFHFGANHANICPESVRRNKMILYTIDLTLCSIIPIIYTGGLTLRQYSFKFAPKNY